MNPYLDIIIFAVVAVFLLLRLRGVLGEHDDQDQKQGQKKAERVEKEIESIARRIEEEKGSKSKKKEQQVWPGSLPDFSIVSSATVHNKLLQIHATEPGFDPKNFLAGAMRAYDMILEAFENNDRSTIELLVEPKLAKKVFKKLEQGGQDPTDGKIPVAQEALITSASLEKSDVTLTVDFWAADLSTPKVAGEYDKRKMFHDRWVFRKDIKDSNNIWLLNEILEIDEA